VIDVHETELRLVAVAPVGLTDAIALHVVPPVHFWAIGTPWPVGSTDEPTPTHPPVTQDTEWNEPVGPCGIASFCGDQDAANTP
jgi:hypothetical protein